jgi:Bacterial Ig domain
MRHFRNRDRRRRVCTVVLLTAACAVAAAAGRVQISAQSQAADIPGETVSGAQIAYRATWQLASEEEASSLDVPRPRRRRVVTRPPFHRSVRFGAQQGAEAAAHAGEDVSAPATLTLNFTGATLGELGSLPPDPSGGAGPAQYILAANGRIRSFSKATATADGVLNVTTNAFFASVRAGLPTFTPKVKYDRLAGRWFITAATEAIPGRILIASSNASTITASTVWSYFAFDNSFPGTNCAVDSPTLGIDPYALYIGVVQFCDGGATYAGTSGFVARKTSVIDAATPVITAFHNLTGTVAGPGPFAPQGVDIEDLAIGVGFFIGVDNASLGTIAIRRVSNPGTTPVISSNIMLAVPATAAPIRVRHLGNLGGADGQMDGGDDRLTSASIRNNRLWTAHTIGVTETGVASGAATRNGVRWYDIGSLTGTPTLMQSGTLFSSGAPGSFDQRNYWVPSIATSTRGRTIVGFSAAGTSEFINGGVAERFQADAPGTLRAPQLATAANDAYNPPGDPGSATRGRRWGGASDTVEDGCDGSSIWTIQQFVDAPNSYALQVVRTAGAGPATPVGVNPTVIPSGVPSIDLQVTASSSGGTAFFDPGAGYLCRLSASIPGVTVNSVTMTGPTTATVNVSTVFANPGLKAITLINPDGQSASSGAILRVTPGPFMVVEAPVAGPVGQPLNVQGWAVDGKAASGTGVTAVHVWAFPQSGNPVFLGAATYGLSRPDVAAAHGGRFAASGFTLRAPSVLPAGPWTIVIYALSAATGTFNNTVSIDVTLSPPAPPFGAIDTPANGVTVAGEVPVTGWVLDDAGVAAVDVYRAPVGAESGLVFLGRAVFIRGARPDVQAAFPSIPFNDNAGWGFMVLTNMLPNQGNGTFDLHVYATDYAGLSTHLGTRRIIAANAGSTRPFGTIDTPGQGETVSGTIVNFGWALAPQPRIIPIDGSTIDVYIDGVFRGHPVYNNNRADLASLFPGLRNSNGAVGYFVIDTTTLSNGLHTINWVIRDDIGQVSGVGSRFFRVQNGS